jgi:hypothetical protein
MLWQTKELSRIDLRIPHKAKGFFDQALETGGFPKASSLKEKLLMDT